MQKLSKKIQKWTNDGFPVKTWQKNAAFAGAVTTGIISSLVIFQYAADKGMEVSQMYDEMEYQVTKLADNNGDMILDAAEKKGIYETIKQEFDTSKDVPDIYQRYYIHEKTGEDPLSDGWTKKMKRARGAKYLAPFMFD